MAYSPDELLATTRSVRKRLGLTRPVEREVLTECRRPYQWAATASSAQNWHFVVVRQVVARQLQIDIRGTYIGVSERLVEQ